MSLEDAPLARIRTKTELLANKELIFVAGRDDVLAHPLRSAELLAEVDEAATDAQLIIQQHHLRPDGSGFPSQSKSKVAPLSCLFVIAEDFVHYYETLPSERRGDALRPFLAETQSEYNSGAFRSIWRELSESLKR